MTGTGRPRAEASARLRHPSARADGGNLVAPLARLGPALGGVVGPHRAVAVAAVAVRGAQGRSGEAFARAYGLAAAELAAIEAGEVAPDALPAPLRHLTAITSLARRAEPAATGPQPVARSHAAGG